MRYILAGLLFVFVFSAVAQKQKPVTTIKSLVQKNEIEAHLSFLAADEMRGRDTGSPELAIAGNYIAAYFKRMGLKELPGAPNYFQPVDLEKVIPPSTGEVEVLGQKFVLKENMLLLSGDDMAWSGDLVYVGYGSSEELAKANIKGKMVLALAGARNDENINKMFGSSRDKNEEVKKLGGLGLIEILSVPQVPWPALVNYFSGVKWGIKSGAATPHIWLKADASSLTLKELETSKGQVTIAGSKQELVKARNVVGLVEGTDPKLKEQYVIMSAHYDHIGVGRPDANQDSIFNGARDNAIGTVGLLQAAKYFSQNPPKRSVILIAVTSEEKGALGSHWYADHPLVPLNKHVIDINCDGVGYNDKTMITSISMGRTSVDNLLATAAKECGLALGGDPDPKEGFYGRSDQISFAKKGIPAIKLQTGLKQMDDEIRKYYHRQADEVSSLDFDYLVKFYQAYVYASSLIANDSKTPTWVKGDEYEVVGKQLYGTK